jgi:hypothetical protein
MPISTIGQNGLNAPLSLTTPNLGTPSALVLTNATALPKAALPSGSVLQVVQSTKTDTFSTTNGTNNPATITGLSASITPATTSNKVLIFVNFGQVSANSDSTWGLFMYRNGTLIDTGNTAGVRALGSAAGGIPASGGTWRGNPASIMYLDSPASTSSVSYTFALGGNSGSTIYLNQDARDTNVGYDSTRTPIVIILQEIVA